MKSLKLKQLTTIVNLTLFASIALAQTTEQHLNPIRTIWTGVYGGFNLGGVFKDADLNSHHLGLIGLTGTCNANSNFSSFFPGVQLGYLHQLDSNVVLGIEGDLTYNTDQTDKVTCQCPFIPSVADRYTIKNHSQGSIRGRLGYLFKPQLLSFVSAGGSFTDLGASYSNEGGDYYSTKTGLSGWLIGGGLEWGFVTDWSIRAEYSYIDYNSINLKIPNIYGLYDPNGNARVNLSTNNIRLALNHWF